MVSRRSRATAHPACPHRLRNLRSPTTYGIIGIKVWVFKGEIMGRNEQPVACRLPPDRRPSRRAAKPAGADKPKAPAKRVRKANQRCPASAKERQTTSQGRNKPVWPSGPKVSFGEWGLKATGAASDGSRQIEAARRAPSPAISSVVAVSGSVSSPTSRSHRNREVVWVTARATRNTGLPKSSPAGAL